MLTLFFQLRLLVATATSSLLLVSLANFLIDLMESQLLTPNHLDGGEGEEDETDIEE
jgi:hypothetical protein